MSEPRSTLKIDLCFVLLYLLSTAAQFYALRYSPLDLSADEAHYWDWSRRLDLSYFSKGPLVALMISAGTTFLGDTALGVRLPAFLTMMLFFLFFYIFLRQLLKPIVALQGWVVLRTTLHFNSAGLLMTTDAPLGLCWLLALFCGYFALKFNRRWWWILFGLFVGIGALAKYTIFLLYVSIFLFLITSREARKHLFSPLFLLGGVIAALVFSPVVIWNIEHGWVNFSHNAGHLIGKSWSVTNPRYLFEFLGAQFGLGGIVTFSLLLWAFYTVIRRWADASLEERYFFFSCLPLFILCLGVSIFRKVYDNWPMPIFIGGVCLVLVLLPQLATNPERERRLFRYTIFSNSMILALSYLLFFGVNFGIPINRLPTKKIIGWAELGAEVDRQLQEVLVKTGKSPVVISESYQTASAVAFYSSSHPRVYCANVGSRRMNQYDIWGGWEMLAGRTALIVWSNSELDASFAKRFARISPVAEQQIVRNEQIVRRFYFFIAEGYDGTPQFPGDETALMTEG